MEVIKLLAMVMIVSLMLQAGLQVDLSRLTAVLRDYGLLARALLVNFVLVPLVAFLLIRAFHVQTDVATGILLMSMAPGVPFIVNSAGRKQGGSISLVLTIAFFFTLLSVITVPLTMTLLLPSDQQVHLPAGKFLTTLLLFQLVPLVVSALVAPRLAENVAEKIAKALQYVFLAAGLAFLVLAFEHLAGAVSAVFGFGQLLIIVAMGIFSIGAGWLAGGKNREYRRTLSIATTLRNIGLCALIASDAVFAGTLVLPTILSYFVITFLMATIVGIFYARTKESHA